MKSHTTLMNALGWSFGLLFLVIGLVNTFWGNDPFFGVFIVLLSLMYFPPVNSVINRKTGFQVPWWVKIGVGLFILWAALGVGELFDKVDMMVTSFS